MGLNAPDEGVMDSVDRIQLMLDRGQGPQEPITVDSIRKQMGLRPLKDEERKQLGLK
jgi:hypothetical protein